MIPVVQADPDLIERAGVINRITHLAVQGEWDVLSKTIADWEERLESTPGGARHHEIAVDACLAGLRSLLDETDRTSIASLDRAEREVARFVERHCAAPQDHILAVLAARAHIMVAASCPADFWPDADRADAWRRMAHHYLKAEAILNHFDAVAFMSPLVAGACYELALGMPDGGTRLRPAFEDWIDLDPSNPEIYATHMPQLAHFCRDNPDVLLGEALRAEERTDEALGQAGYALCLIPVLDLAPEMREHIDTARFGGALMDMARMSGTQSEVNWAAAILDHESQFGSEERRATIQSAFDALVRRNLTVIYPRIWNDELQNIRARLAETFQRAGTPKVTVGQYYPAQMASKAA
ncbi:MAG: hypothetical protein GKR98_16310 [Boseongicola sp.]|nr:MAG: hypothetical protein GKR98_16310 [Boseongicola sp.]